jgi:hypothetical protein
MLYRHTKIQSFFLYGKSARIEKLFNTNLACKLLTLKIALKTHKNTQLFFLNEQSTRTEQLFNIDLAYRLLTDLCPWVA